MEDAHQIVLQALEQAGVALPPGVDSVQDITSAALVSVCGQSLDLIRAGGTPVGIDPIPLSLPQAMSERFRVCTDLAGSIRQLGYRGDLSFHQFLYPSEEGTYKVLRFLLDTLSKSSFSSKGRSVRKDRGSKSASGDLGTSKTLTAVRRALSLCLEEANQLSNIENAQQSGDDGFRDGNLVSFKDISRSVAGRIPFRTCPLRVASSSSFPGSVRKTPALITLQAKPRSCLPSSVIELNAKNALYAARVLDDQLAHLAGHANNSLPKKAQDVKISTYGSLQVNKEASAQASAQEETVYSSYFARAVQFSREQDQIVDRDLHVDEETHNNENSRRPLDLDTPEAQEALRQRELAKLEKKLNRLITENDSMLGVAEELNQKTTEFTGDVEALIKESEILEEKLSVLKAAVDMALESTDSSDSIIGRLHLAIKEKQQQIVNLNTEWDAVRKPLEEKQIGLETLVKERKGEIQSKLQEMKEIRHQIKDVNGKLRNREERLATLATELENSPKGATRNTYVRRIAELIKNSKKQDSDIAHIINETRELQRESNAQQGRLHRTHVLVDELIFRDAKKDPVCRQAYILLSSIHEDFADCFEKVFDLDKLHRDIAELQAEMEALEKWPVDISKVQADVDAIVAENQYLEKELNETRETGKEQN